MKSTIAVQDINYPRSGTKLIINQEKANLVL